MTRCLLTKHDVPNDPIRRNEVLAENNYNAGVRRLIENNFADIKNTWRYSLAIEGQRVQRGEIGDRRNSPVLFARQEIAVTCFLHNLRSLTRQNRISQRFNFVREGVDATGKTVLPSLEAYAASFL